MSDSKCYKRTIQIDYRDKIDSIHLSKNNTFTEIKQV